MLQDVARHQAAVASFFDEYAQAWEDTAQMVYRALLNGRKMLVCGNGGSACDAMHIVGEFVGRFVRERDGMAAIALNTDVGIITAVGNDYGFEQIFARQVQALGQEGDVLIAMSTSGGSPNVLAALAEAKRKGLKTVLMTGAKGRERREAEHVFAVQDTETARIQEVHMLALHLLAGRVEQLMMDKERP